jgi:hypothetical protein
MKKALYTFLLLAIPVTAAPWTLVEPGMVATPKKGGYSVQLPPGWIYDTPSNAVIVASRDGMLLNEIRLELAPHDKVFKGIKKRSSPDALPEDLAEMYVASIQAAPNIHDVEVLATEPAELAGHQAFRVHLRYHIPEGMGGAVFDRVAVGAPLATGLLIVHFEAPGLYQFPKWAPAFEEMLKFVTVGQ